MGSCSRRRSNAFVVCAALAVSYGFSAHAVLSLSVNPATATRAGVATTWTATSTEADPMEYRFSVMKAGEPFKVVYDFSPQSVFEWTPIDDGYYTVAVTRRNLNTQAMSSVYQFRNVLAPSMSGPRVYATDHPLVAFYSAPPSASAAFTRVMFRPTGNGVISYTNMKPSVANRCTNFYIAGMLANQTYDMRYQRFDASGALIETGPLRRFTTGSVAANVTPASVESPPDANTSIKDKVILQDSAIGPANQRFPFATNLGGQVIWYYDPQGLVSPIVDRVPGGGTLLAREGDENGVDSQILREIDLAGNVVRQTTVPRINVQLAAMGEDPISAFHHESYRLPNGYTASLGHIERVLEDVQGPGPVDILADNIMVLDQNFQVVWVWNAFDELDVTRAALLGETCAPGQGGCPPYLLLGTISNDWLHSNALEYSPTDGNLLLSIRHQDWVIKIDYRDGYGTGDVIWRLGEGGDFTINSSDPNPWLSHQHNPTFVGLNRLAVYDNGNTRVATTGVPYSRGQVYDIDEANMVVNLVLNADLGNYSFALGSAQKLSNGNYHFNSGIQGVLPNVTTTSDEVLPDGSLNYSLRVQSAVYRSFRAPDLYTNASGAPLNLGVVVAKANSNTLSLFRGDGKGGFEGEDLLDVGGDPSPPPGDYTEHEVVVGDVNNDGQQDIINTNTAVDTISVTLGDGQGGFLPQTEFPVGARPRGLAVADFNQDGNEDLAVANQDDDNVSILLGDGTGDFGAPTNFGTGNTPVCISVADFNNDGRPDVITPNFAAASVSVLLGNGLGGLGAKTDFAVGNSPVSAIGVDLNDDGAADIVTADAFPDTATVLFGDGVGGFAGLQTVAVGDFPHAVVAADMNNDGNQDFVTANSGADTVSVVLGDGLGGSISRVDFAVGDFPHSVVVGDINHDGNSDVVTANSSNDTATVLFGDGSGGLSGGQDLAIGAGEAAWWAALGFFE